MPGAPTLCPACGGTNAHDAVFCANPACGKALGGFRYVAEELQARAQWHERVAERVVAFVGQGAFIVVHVVLFVLWVAANTGVVTIAHPFDMYPFGLLGVVVGVEAIFLSGFLLISQNRERAHDAARAEVDYETLVLMNRRIEAIEAMVRQLVDRPL